MSAACKISRQPAAHCGNKDNPIHPLLGDGIKIAFHSYYHYGYYKGLAYSQMNGHGLAALAIAAMAHWQC
jgi:hypothetical protein